MIPDPVSSAYLRCITRRRLAEARKIDTLRTDHDAFSIDPKLLEEPRLVFTESHEGMRARNRPSEQNAMQPRGDARGEQIEHLAAVNRLDVPNLPAT